MNDNNVTETKPFNMISDPHSKLTRLEPTSSSSIYNEASKKPISPQEHFHGRQLKVLNSIQENIGVLTTEKKWIIALVMAILVILIYSTFTVSLIDQFLFKHNIDLFSKESQKNEIILNVVQFLFVFLFFRIGLSTL
jgi:hypothetical protein